MPEHHRPPVGTIAWVDLSVRDAPSVRDFYTGVCGWTAEEVPMGEYADFNMIAQSTGFPVAGVCHARGVNEGLPAQWLMYVVVADLDQALAAVPARGGTVLRQRTSMGSHGDYGVVRDPAGAVLAVFQAK
ncbi:MAG: VOC family protein [Gemmatimonadetes bacterium]|nr:VOC family protein [Gemmatimonadota bacterium]